jgi:hypothetical protein
MPHLFDKTIGSRSEVGHGTAERTSGGLYQSDLVLGADGHWKSKKKAGQVPPQLKPFIDAHAKILKKQKVPKSGGSFDDYTIKKGTKAYKDFMKMAKK